MKIIIIIAKIIIIKIIILQIGLIILKIIIKTVEILIIITDSIKKTSQLHRDLRFQQHI